MGTLPTSSELLTPAQRGALARAAGLATTPEAVIEAQNWPVRVGTKPGTTHDLVVPLVKVVFQPVVEIPGGQLDAIGALDLQDIKRALAEAVNMPLMFSWEVTAQATVEHVRMARVRLTYHHIMTRPDFQRIIDQATPTEPKTEELSTMIMATRHTATVQVPLDGGHVRASDVAKAAALFPGRAAIILTHFPDKFELQGDWDDEAQAEWASDKL